MFPEKASLWTIKMEIMSFKPTRGHCYNLPWQRGWLKQATEQVVTHRIFHKVFILGNIQSMGVEIQSKRIRTLILSLSQELRATFVKMPNKVVVTSGQVVTFLRGSCNRFIAASKCRVAAKIYLPPVSYPQFCFFIRDEHKFMPVSVLYIY